MNKGGKGKIGKKYDGHIGMNSFLGLSKCQEIQKKT